MDTCVSCGDYVPEGRMVCGKCEKNGGEVQPMIKDSGQRREFPTGAVRDIVAGKGRYDLLPWDVIHNLAIWVEQGIRIDLVPWEAVRELAIHCGEGAKKYGERNCEKGIPISSLIDSGFRHLSKYMQGAKDEPHLRAAFWNIAFAIWTELNKPELQDIPTRKEA